VTHTSSTDHLVQDDEDGRGVAEFLAVVVDVRLVILYACSIVVGWWRGFGVDGSSDLGFFVVLRAHDDTGYPAVGIDIRGSTKC
jgi:hypothetical protein